MKQTDIQSFATSQLTLLDHELQAELAETQLLTSTHAPTVLQRAGLALLNLTLSSQRTGFGGKTLLELGLDPAVGGGDLPEHGLRTGDICAVAEQPKGAERKKERESMEERGCSGVVTRVQREAVTVALDKDEVEVPRGKLWLVKLANSATSKRLTHTMTTLQLLPPASHTPLTQVLFGHSSPIPPSSSDLQSAVSTWHDPSLNSTQQAAIRFALASENVALIHGPPGTGKTHTLIELILQFLDRGQRVLVCGPSNISVDNIVERLSHHRISGSGGGGGGGWGMVRLGHPARLLPSVLRYSLDVLSKSCEAAGIVADVRAEMDGKQSLLRKARGGRERRAVYGELRELRREYRVREGRVGGIWVIVDEASQALEAQCWIPVLASGAPKLVLAGDHLQLPPTIKSLNTKHSKLPAKKTADADEVANGVSKLSTDDDKSDTTTGNLSKSKDEPSTLETTLFDRLLALHGNTIKRMLTTQYRMHDSIMAFPSAALYENQLIAAESVRTRLLTDLPYPVQDTEDTREPVVFWDTQGGDFAEKAEDEEGATGAKGKGSLLAESKVNEHEAAIVRLHVGRLVAAGVREEDIAVVTPYNGQLSLLAQTLKERFPGLELGSIDGFQGREKEAVVVSLVRSNAEREVGFLGEKRRLNGRSYCCIHLKQIGPEYDDGLGRC
ncbi:hypothetical protein LTR74_008002 [Friedmanniomyces endolithicus]|nr:hypothetical protein LTR74_008002 [Friedmanniomyces endolithicus]